jgi:hypothetical protein
MLDVLTYSLGPIIVKFLKFFKQIKDVGKRHMYSHFLSFLKGYLLDLAVVVCMYP